MCIIAYKPKGHKIPYKSFKNCFDNNDDGAGYMYAHNGKVYIHKGFLDLKSLNDSLRDTFKHIPERQTTLVIHFRFATHGKTSQGNTHPFPLSKSEAELTKLLNTCKVGVAHNGIISGLPKDKQLSDTMIFIQNVMSKFDFKQLVKPEIKALIELATASKWIIMDGTGDVILYGGEWTEGQDKILYSNTGYLTSYNWTEAGYWKGHDYDLTGYGSQEQVYLRKAKAGKLTLEEDELDRMSYKANIAEIDKCNSCGMYSQLTAFNDSDGTQLALCNSCFDRFSTWYDELDGEMQRNRSCWT